MDVVIEFGERIVVAGRGKRGDAGMVWLAASLQTVKVSRNKGLRRFD